MLKGRTVYNWFLGSNHGGWGLNPSPPADLSINEDLKTNPFFDKTYDTDLFGVTGSEYASMNRDRILSDSIPSSTLAIGRKAVPRLEAEGEEFNLNMNAQSFRDAWPSNRQADEQNWHHSDIRDVAYFFVHLAFDELVDKGGLE
jgi:hypothetical protein